MTGSSFHAVAYTKGQSNVRHSLPNNIVLEGKDAEIETTDKNGDSKISKVFETCNEKEIVTEKIKHASQLLLNIDPHDQMSWE